MGNEDYKRFIADMVNHIDSNRALKAIYEFVQKHFLRR